MRKGGAAAGDKGWRTSSRATTEVWSIIFSMVIMALTMTLMILMRIMVVVDDDEVNQIRKEVRKVLQSTFLTLKSFNFEPTLFDEPSKKWQISGMYSCCRWTWITAGRVITWLICRYAWPPNTTRVTPHPIRSQSALLAPVITCMALLGCYVWSGNHMPRPPSISPQPCWPYHCTHILAMNHEVQEPKVIGSSLPQDDKSVQRSNVSVFSLFCKSSSGQHPWFIVGLFCLIDEYMWLIEMQSIRW